MCCTSEAFTAATEVFFYQFLGQLRLDHHYFQFSVKFDLHFPRKAYFITPPRRAILIDRNAKIAQRMKITLRSWHPSISQAIRALVSSRFSRSCEIAL